MKKIAVITGASSGIGNEMAKHVQDYFLFDELWLIARRSERLSELKGELEKSNPFSVKTIPLDLTKKESAAFYETMLKSGDYTIVLLINNAGSGTYGTFNDTPITLSLDMLYLNCTSLVHISALSIPHMSEGACIINVASLAAFMPLGNFALYAASKSLVLHFSLALRAELKAKGINVTAMCPGPVQSEFSLVASRGAVTTVRGGADTEKVVCHALKCASKKKAIGIMKIKWKLLAICSHFFSKNSIAHITAQFYKREYS